MRVFIAINIPENIKKEIKEIQKSLPEFLGKKTELENLHLTLKFLGEIDEEKVEQIKEKLREIKFNKFETEINELGVFSEEFIRIVWLHLLGAEDLQKQIDDKLNGLFRKEERFMSHLTIARIKSIKDKKEFLKKLNEIKILKVKFSVGCFKLIESILKPQGPVYKTLEVYNLT